MVNIEVQQISDIIQGITKGQCIGTLIQPEKTPESFNTMKNFKISALLFDDFEEAMNRKSEEFFVFN